MADLRSFRHMLPVNKDRLDDELEVHAQVMDQVCQSLNVAENREEDAKNELKIIEAKLFDEFKQDGERVTDKSAESQVLRSRERMQAWQKLQAASQERKEWERFLASWRAKEGALKALCGLYAAQYFVLTSHQMKERNDRRGGERAALDNRASYSGGYTRERVPERESAAPTRRRVIE